MRIFVIDDHPVVRMGIKILVEQVEGWFVVGEATNSKNYREQLVQADPSIVIVDIKLEGGANGIEIIKDLSQNYQIKTIVLSGYMAMDIAMEAIHAGARGAVSKASWGQEILTAIDVVSRGGTYLDTMFEKETRKIILEKTGRAEVLGLTNREIQVMNLIVNGYENKEIANKLNISFRTVEVHRAAIFKKIGIKNAVELTKYAIKMGYISV